MIKMVAYAADRLPYNGSEMQGADVEERFRHAAADPVCRMLFFIMYDAEKPDSKVSYPFTEDRFGVLFETCSLLADADNGEMGADTYRSLLDGTHPMIRRMREWGDDGITEIPDAEELIRNIDAPGRRNRFL